MKRENAMYISHFKKILAILLLFVIIYRVNTANSLEVTLVNIVDTTVFGSSDPSGLTFLSDDGPLLLSDSEIEETPFFTGNNIFELILSDDLIFGLSTLGFSKEPTGVSFNTVTGTLFLTDDDKGKVFEVDPLEPDVVLTSFSTRNFGSTDPEGITFDPITGNLFITDGIEATVHEVTPAGLPVSSVRVRDVVRDPEGIYFDVNSGNFFLVSGRDEAIFVVTTNGVLVTVIDLQSVGVAVPKGITFAPSSDPADDPDIFHLFVADYGRDEVNDGRLFEFSLANQPPVVDAGPDQTTTLSARVALRGTVTAEGFLSGDATTLWSQESGPGTVTFADASAIATTAHFSATGTYILRLTAIDGEFSAFDELTAVVFADGTTMTVEIRVDASSDDAEERISTGKMIRHSRDLDLEDVKAVGIRFKALRIPQGATIHNAYVQFKASATAAGDVALMIDGEAVGNAPTFLKDVGNLISREPTAAAVVWSPPAWQEGDVGPDQQTPNLSSIIQEIVDRPDWSSGNALVLIIMATGSSERNAASFEGDNAEAPLLYVEYADDSD